MEDFNDASSIAPYAILSHTWATEEISYEMMVANKAGQTPIIYKPGEYQKIASFCRLVGIRYLQ